MPSRSRSVVRRLAVLVLVLGTIAPTGVAHAAGYTTGTTTTCGGYDAGGRDAAATLYLPCRSGIIHVVTAAGLETDVSIDAPGLARVAPSPTGDFLYSIDATGGMRFRRAADGSYRRDAGFTLQAPAGWAAQGWKVCGWGIATDAYGAIYVSNGGWCEPSPQAILKFRPDGTLVTSFGDYGIATKWMTDALGQSVVEWNHEGAVPGSFQPNMGIAVTADGSRIWVADENNQRVQFFDRRIDLTYGYAGMWSGEGTAWDGQLGAIYGVALDPWGAAYVTQTTTKQVWHLDPDGTHPTLVASRGATDPRDHTLAVDARGRVWVGEWKTRFDRTAANPVPGPLPVLPPEPRPDIADPTLTSISAPSESFEQAVAVALVASDDIAVTQVRLADESGEWGAWTTYHASLQVQLSPGIGTKMIYVQVRDAWSHESNVRSALVALRSVPDVTAPTLTATAPAASTVTSVTVTVSSSDAVGVTHVRIAGDDGIYSAWEPWTAGVRLRVVELVGEYGAKGVSVQVRDAAYNVSDTAHLVIRYGPPAPPAPPVPPTDVDRVAPHVRALLLPARTCSRRILLRIAASDDHRLAFVRVADGRGRFGRWLRWSPRVIHTLGRGATGTTLIRVQVRDSSGNVSRVASRSTRVVACRR